MTEASSDAHDDGGEGEARQALESLVEAAMSLVVAAAHGDPQAGAALSPVLDQMAGDAEMAGFAASLRAIIAGDRDGVRLSRGLDPDLQAVVSRVLAALPADPAGAITRPGQAPKSGRESDVTATDTPQAGTNARGPDGS